MYPKLVWKRLLGVLFFPKSEWKAVRKDREIALETILLLLIVCFIFGFSAKLSMGVNWAVYTFIPFITLLLSSIIVRLALPKLRKMSWEKGLSIVVYPNILAIIIQTLSMLIGFRKYLLPLSILLMLVYTFMGIKFLFNFSRKETMYLFAMHFLIYFICFYFLLVLLSD